MIKMGLSQMKMDSKSSPKVPAFPIPAWAEFVAQDGDGTWWAYEAHPNQQENGWYENEAGRIKRLGKSEAPLDFRQMLIRVTEINGQGADSHLNE